jgi:hypothetical protein
MNSSVKLLAAFLGLLAVSDAAAAPVRAGVNYRLPVAW